jgi:RHS repeat-associated protein
VPSAVVSERYVRGDNPDELLVWYNGSGSADRRFVATDERGSVVATTDSSGALVGINTYDEYGRPGASNIGRFQYTGQMWLPELGLYDYKARMYEPNGGRFMQTDPAGMVDSPNLYEYALDNPVNLTDPTGLAKACSPSTGNQIVVCGNRIKKQNKTVTIPQLPIAGPITGGGGGFHGQPTQQQKKQQKKKTFTCADAMKESGQIRASGFSVTLVGIIGWTGTSGTWRNMSTGTTGRFNTFGFSAGVEFAAGGSVVTYQNIGAFTGGSDGYSVGAAVPVGPVAVGGSYQHSSNDSGSGSGGSGGVGPAAGIPPVGASGNFTTTDISQCKPGS